MGGNLFPQAKRMTKAEFLSSVDKQKAILRPLNLHPRVPTPVHDKQSFGDIDMVVPKGFSEQIRAILDNHGLLYSSNGDVLSYLSHDKHQIDLIQVEPQFKNYAHNYFSFGDTGNILGRIVKNQFSLKNSFKGLRYVYRKDNDSYSREFVVSLQYGDLLDLLELDKEQYYHGFYSNQQLFDWIYQCPYLDTDIFKFENLNHVNRVRDRKRKFYNDWLVYLADKPKKPTKHPLALSDYFPAFSGDYAKMDNEYQEMKSCKDKFNGTLVSQITGLTDKELGSLMERITQNVSREQILAMTTEQVADLINWYHTGANL